MAASGLKDESVGRARARRLWGTFALAAALAAAPVRGWPAASGEAGFRKEVDGFAVYLAVMPAAVLRGPAAEEVPGASPFRRPPAPRDTHHVMVSLFDLDGGRRVTGARVEARVAALGFSGAKKALELTDVAGAPVYAARFPMQGRGPFRVDVEFLPAGATRASRVRFYFTHPSFAPPRAR